MVGFYPGNVREHMHEKRWGNPPVLDHAELAAHYVPALSGYVPWTNTVGVIVKAGKTTHKALVELNEREDAKTVVLYRKPPLSASSTDR